MLRDHALFHKPLPIDLKKTTAIDTPEAFRNEIKAVKVDVLPLARDPTAKLPPGWCTYTRDMHEAPEIEVLCGGINAKTATAGAVWRQGNLLHYGFDLSAAAYGLIAVLVVFAALESVLGFCMGCKVFAALMRIGVIPASVCEECNDLTLRWARLGAPSD